MKSIKVEEKTAALSDLRLLRLHKSVADTGFTGNVELHCGETGDILELAYESFDGKFLLANAPFCEEQLKIPARNMNLLRFVQSPPEAGEDDFTVGSRLSLRNGDELPFQDWVYTGKMIKLTSPVLEGEIEIPMKEIVEMRIAPGATKYVMKSGRLNFTDGSFLNGEITAKDGDTFLIQSSWGQEISIPRDQVISEESQPASVKVLASMQQENPGFTRLKRSFRAQDNPPVPFEPHESIPSMLNTTMSADAEKFPVVSILRAEVETDAVFPEGVYVSMYEQGTKKPWHSYNYHEMYHKILVDTYNEGERKEEKRIPIQKGRNWEIAVLLDFTNKISRFYVNGQMLDEMEITRDMKETAGSIQIRLNDDTILHNLQWLKLDENAAADLSGILHRRDLPGLENALASETIEVWGPGGSAKLYLKKARQTGNQLRGQVPFSEDEIIVPLGWIRRIVVQPEALENRKTARPPWVSLDYRLP